jgi:hypothetical protein
MKRYLNELNEVELNKVYDANKELRDEVYDMEYEAGKVYIDDIMFTFKEAGAIQGYSVELAGRSNYINIIDAYKFFDILLELPLSFEMKDKYKFVFELAQEGLDLVTARDAVKMHDKVYDMLDDKLDNVLWNIDIQFMSMLENFLNYDEENNRLMFHEYVHNHEEFDEVYIDDDSNSFIAYKDMVKVYK